MIKIIDVDTLFDQYISDYVYSNIGKVKPEEIENQIPALYVKFGKTPLKELDGYSPEKFYVRYNAKELLSCLKKHIEEGVSVSDFLCEALTEKSDAEDALILALNEEGNEEFTLYVLNMLGEKQSEKAKDRYLEFVLFDYSEGIRELATELLSAIAEKVKEQVLIALKDADENKKVNLVEILSNCKNDDRVFDVLVKEFAVHQENIPLYAGYLSKYGDERALPFLLKAIEGEKISYADYEELRFAIEALGGEYNKTRDFSKDKTYKKIKGVKNDSQIN